MVAFDTNVVVRLLLRDDAAQARRAERAFLQHARGEGVFLPLVVVVETVWVLTYTYELGRDAVHQHLFALTRTRGVVVDEADLVQEALDSYAAGAADFADYVILARSGHAGCDSLLTFDRRLAREPGASSP